MKKLVLILFTSQFLFCCKQKLNDKINSLDSKNDVSVENTVIEDNLIKETINTDEVTGEKSKISMKYSDMDSEGNPQKVEMFEGETNSLIQVSIREFRYF